MQPEPITKRTHKERRGNNNTGCIPCNPYGITLIALVITIIVLLILAGTSITMILGTNGIIGKAKQAKNEYEYAESEEIRAINELGEKVEGFNWEKGVNSPKLDANMIPIKWDENKKVWVITNQTDKEWYDYQPGRKKWANVMLGDGKYQAGSAIYGTEVTDKELGSMFVWIPRFSYSITKGYHQEATTGENATGEIQINFLKGTSDEFANNSQKADRSVKVDTGHLETATKMTNFVVHPCFTNESQNDYKNGGWDKELTGFWIAKFEASSNEPKEGASYGGSDNINLNVKVKPNVTSWRNISVKSMQIVTQKMTQIGNEYGLSYLTDSHIAKNSEWGAVAYLSQSQYGKNAPIWNNPYGEDTYYTTKTGCASNLTDANQAKDSGLTLTDFDRYSQGNGPQASTTGNIFGVYDMAGGAHEYTASYLKESSSNSNVNYFESLPGKYRIHYEGKSEGESWWEECYKNSSLNKDCYGDALWEISSYANSYNTHSVWNIGHSTFVYSNSPFFVRGGGNDSYGQGDVFSYDFGHINSDAGRADYNITFRPILIL